MNTILKQKEISDDMKEKLVAIGKSFLATVVPSFSIIIAILYGGTLANMAFELQGIWFLIGIIILIPMGILGVASFVLGGYFAGVVWSNMLPLSINGSTTYIDMNPKVTGASKAGGAGSILLNLLLLIVTVPLSIVLWIIQVIIILCRKDAPDYYCGKAILISLGMALLTVVSSLIWIPIGIQNAINSPEKFAFQAYDFKVGEPEWTGIPYYVYYTLENVKNDDFAKGDMIIEVKGTDQQFVVNNISLIPFKFTGDGEAKACFYVLKNDLDTIDFLSADYENMRITFAVKKSIAVEWNSFFESKDEEKYSYQGKYKIVLKDF